MWYFVFQKSRHKSTAFPPFYIISSYVFFNRTISTETHCHEVIKSLEYIALLVEMMNDASRVISPLKVLIISKLWLGRNENLMRNPLRERFLLHMSKNSSTFAADFENMLNHQIHYFNYA